MGASSASGMTLIDVLAARKDIGLVGGHVLLGGIARGSAFQRGSR